MPELPARVRRVVLVGLMGAGKTTVGQLLAGRLGWSFRDLDAVIEQRAGKTVAELFAQEGENAFRRLEQQLTAELASTDRLVLTPGGGWVTRPETVAELKGDTAVFWLQVSPDEAVRRVQQDPVVRPLLKRDEPIAVLRRLAQERNSLYAQIGVPVQTVDRAPSDIVTEITSYLGARIVDARALHESNG